MRKINIFFVMFLLCPFFAQAEVTKGNCNSNFVVIIGGEYSCLPKASKADREEIEQLAGQIETIRTENSVFADETSRQIKKLSGSNSSNQVKSELRGILSKHQSRIDNIEKAFADLERKIKKETPNIKSGPPPAIVLDPIPQLSFVPTPKSRETVQQVINKSKCYPQLESIEKAITDQYPELIRLIIATESIDCEEKKYWFSIFPSMTDKQVSRLFNILETERNKLEELEIRYINEIVCLNKKHLIEWAEFQKKEAKTEEEKDKSLMAVIEASLETLDSDECKGMTPSSVYIDQGIAMADRLGKTDSGALLLARVYETKKYNNPDKARKWKFEAFRIAPNDWNNFHPWVQHLQTVEDYAEVFRISRIAIESNQMSELRSFSEKQIARKIWIFKAFTDAADKTRQHPPQSLGNVIREGYNISKYSLERNPSAKNLRDTIYFAGRFRLLGDIERQAGLRYLASLTSIAEKMYAEGVILGSDLAGSSLSISWYCLTLKDFDCAINVSKKGLKASPNSLALNTNLAHGLLLSGKKDEAHVLYSKNVGKVIDDRKWESVILDDLNELTAVGVTSPDFRLVRQWILKVE